MQSNHSPNKPVISVILPCHNEAENLDLLFTRLESVFEKMAVSYELIAVDDGSTDDTYARLVTHNARNPRIITIRLARNFGKENTVSCGLAHARGDAAIIMDSDLQHPPEVIPDLFKKWKDGAQMVYALRRNRDTDGVLRRQFSHLYYWVFDKIGDIKLPEGAGDFRLLDRCVVDAVNALPERSRFMKGLMSWVGFRAASVEFDVAPRHKGQSSWSPIGLIRFAFDGLLSFSSIPLRMWTAIGGGISIFAFLYMIVLIIQTTLFGIDVPGFATIMVSVLMLGGIQLIGLGVLAEYVSRIFIEVKRRPLYFIADKRGIDDNK
ncbi:MAG: glycosyltransferase family 2 protein [Alphaproteobacteria bacterium]|nr:glycosyltransferase family 2 protein [Alphaproteobacteria bacterium]